MADVLFDGHTITLYKGEDSEKKGGMILACGNTHLFLGYDETAELIKGLNQVAYELFKTRSEIFQ